jgi:hypothetical protein
MSTTLDQSYKQEHSVDEYELSDQSIYELAQLRMSDGTINRHAAEAIVQREAESMDSATRDHAVVQSSATQTRQVIWRAILREEQPGGRLEI